MTESSKIITDCFTTYILDGQLHREDGPAVEYIDGDNFWYRHGKFHREDGPAIELTYGKELWWCLFGTSLSKEEFWKKVYHD